MGSLAVMVTNHQWGHTCLTATTGEKDGRIGIGYKGDRRREKSGN